MNIWQKLAVQNKRVNSGERLEAPRAKKLKDDHAAKSAKIANWNQPAKPTPTSAKTGEPETKEPAEHNPTFGGALVKKDSMFAAFLEQLTI